MGQLNADSLDIGSRSSRPGSPVAGSMIYNTSTDCLEVYNGSSWINAACSFTATGGNSVSTDETRPGWVVHTFTSPGTLTVNGSKSGAEMICVAGGGSGGAADDGGGGGGAGGYRSTTGLTLSSPIPITVGGGGSGTNGSPSPGQGNNGSNSQFGPS